MTHFKSLFCKHMCDIWILDIQCSLRLQDPAMYDPDKSKQNYNELSTMIV